MISIDLTGGCKEKWDFAVNLLTKLLPQNHSGA